MPDVDPEPSSGATGIDKDSQCDYSGGNNFRVPLSIFTSDRGFQPRTAEIGEARTGLYRFP